MRFLLVNCCWRSVFFDELALSIDVNHPKIACGLSTNYRHLPIKNIQKSSFGGV